MKKNKEIYIGIENELISFENNKRVSFINHFNKLEKELLKDEKLFYNSSTSIRTSGGLGFYIDQNEIEILTPPIAINKGFATRLTDCLMIGRDRIIEAIPSLKHTGYSMHWNLTNVMNDESNFFKQIAVPFQLFTQTPLSMGNNLRVKDSSKRFELLADSINNEDQINATALLLGAFNIAAKMHLPMPIIESDVKRQLFLPDGRYSEIGFYKNKEDFFRGAKFRRTQAQNYLELFYNNIKDIVNELGTDKEISNLEDFIFARKELEFDKFKYYSWINDLTNFKKGIYYPVNYNDDKYPGTVLKHSNKKRETPLEAKLIGEVVKKLAEIKSSENNSHNFHLTWDYLYYYSQNQFLSTERRSIRNIYLHGNELNPNLPKYKETLNIDHRDISLENQNLLLLNLLSKKIKYDANKDKFVIPEKNLDLISKSFLNGLKKINILYIDAFIIASVLYVSGHIFKHFDSAYETSKLLKTYIIDVQ